MEKNVERLLYDKLPLLFQRSGMAAENNLKNLSCILRDNANTVYGKKCHFGEIKNRYDYRERIPITKYEDYNGLCQEGNYTAYSFNCCLETSGTTGGQKLFPLTEEALRRYGSFVCDIPNHYWGAEKGPCLHTSVFRKERNGILNLSSAHYRWLQKNGLWNPSSYVGGQELLFPERASHVPYIKVWLGFSCASVISIESVFIYDILCVMDYMEKNWRAVLTDMRNKTVTVDLDEKTKACLLNHIPDLKRIEQVEKVLEEGFETPVIPRLWKEIRYISGIGGSSLDFQTDSLRKYCGTLPIYYLVYGSSECLMGIAPYPDKAEYVLLSDNAYYEFLDEDGNWTEIEELEEGKAYEPVITTFSGLYRYKIGDMLRITRCGDGPVTFEVLGRKNTFNIAGEKLSETVVKIAVRKWAQIYDISLFDYSMGVAYNSVPGGYLLFVEPEEEIPGDADKALDEILLDLDKDYAYERQHGMLDLVKIYVCGKGAISEMIAFDKGHRKHHVFLKHEQTSKLLESIKKI